MIKPVLTASHTTRLSRAARFGAVGAVGLVVNLGAQAALIEGFGVNYLAAAVIATQISSTVNFVLAESWVFGAGGRSDGRAGRYVAFLAMNNVALLLRGPIMWMLTSGLGVHYAVSNLTSLVVLTLIRFGIADSVIWRVPRTAVLATVPSGPATLVTVGAPFSVVDVSARATAQMKLPPPRPLAARAVSPQRGDDGPACHGPPWRHSRSVWPVRRCSVSRTSPPWDSTVTRPCTRDRAPPCSASATRTSTSHCSAPIRCCSSP